MPTHLHDQVFSPMANSSVALSHHIDLQITSPPQAPKFQVRSDVYLRKGSLCLRREKIGFTVNTTLRFGSRVESAGTALFCLAWEQARVTVVGHSYVICMDAWKGERVRTDVVWICNNVLA
jgi:hypothetical protein